MKRKQDEGVKYLTEGEVEAFFSVIRSVRDRALFRLIYRRGLRASEPGTLQLHDWYPEAERLTCRRKKGSITAPFRLTSVEANALRAWIRKRGTAPGPLFLSRKHSPISRYQVHGLMHRYCDEAGIPREKAHPHALKHSCGTHVLAKLQDITQVQDHLGAERLTCRRKKGSITAPFRLTSVEAKLWR